MQKVVCTRQSSMICICPRCTLSLCWVRGQRMNHNLSAHRSASQYLVSCRLYRARWRGSKRSIHFISFNSWFSMPLVHLSDSADHDWQQIVFFLLFFLSFSLIFFLFFFPSGGVWAVKMDPNEVSYLSYPMYGVYQRGRAVNGREQE